MSVELVWDSVSGVNQRCLVPEHSARPTARDVQRSYPLRGQSTDLMWFSLDVKSAHKRVAVHPSHRGLLGFQHQGSYFSTMYALSVPYLVHIFGLE